jgi:hypothetical protein
VQSDSRQGTRFSIRIPRFAREDEVSADETALQAQPEAFNEAGR